MGVVYSLRLPDFLDIFICWYCLLVPVGRLGCLLQLVVGLIKQILGFLSVAFHVPFIGLLGISDPLESLSCKALGRSDVGVFPRADVLGRFLLRWRWSRRTHNSRRQSCQTQQQCDNGKFFKHSGISFHWSALWRS